MKGLVRPHVYHNPSQQGNRAPGCIWAVYSIAASPWGLSPATLPSRRDTGEEHVSQPLWDIWVKQGSWERHWELFRKTLPALLLPKDFL